MDSKKVYLTQEGLVELQKERDDLIKVRRPEVLSRVSTARELGDLSENAEYAAAREELAFIDGRIDELEELLNSVVLISESNGKQNGNGIELGSTVTVKIDGKQEVYQVVGEFEADPLEKKISHESPLGKALLGKKVGEQVEVTAPAGKIVYTIVSVK